MKCCLALVLMLASCTCAQEPVPRTDQPAVHLLDRLPADAVVSGGLPTPGPDRQVYSLPSVAIVRGGTAPEVIDVPVTGGSTYRVQATIHTEALVLGPDSVGASLEVEELDAEGTRLMHHNHMPRYRGTLAGAAVETTLVVRGETTTLRIHLHPGGPEATGTARFEGVTAYQIPGLAGTLSAARWSEDDRIRHLELHEDTRPALVLQADSEVVFDHHVSPPATLRFAIARAKGVTGEVCIRAVQTEELLTWQCTDRARWVEMSVPLQDDAAVHFHIQGPEGAVALLADPRVIPTGRRPGPNVVIITLDTLRADALSSYGAARASPAVDAFAAKSIVYDHAFSVSGWTAPSLASMVVNRLQLRPDVLSYSLGAAPAELR